jgi:hypothetical protein
MKRISTDCFSTGPTNSACQMMARTRTNICHWSVFLLLALLCLTGCGPKKLAWTEEVQLQSGEVLNTRRTALAQPFGQIGGTGGWENEGMTVEIIAPNNPGYPTPWSGKFVPLLLDRDPDTNEWFMVATFYSCTSWYDLGRHKLPYTEFRFKNGQWVQQALSEKLIGRATNMLTSIHSSGEPAHTLVSKERVMSNLKIAPTYKRILDKWETAC